MRIPALQDFRTFKTGRRIATQGTFADAFTEVSKAEKAWSTPYSDVYCMDARFAVTKEIDSESSPEVKNFLFNHMRRELVGYMYGDIIEVLGEASRMAHLEGAPNTREYLDRALRQLSTLIDDIPSEDF